MDKLFLNVPRYAGNNRQLLANNNTMFDEERIGLARKVIFSMKNFGENIFLPGEMNIFHLLLIL